MCLHSVHSNPVQGQADGAEPETKAPEAPDVSQPTSDLRIHAASIQVKIVEEQAAKDSCRELFF